MKRQLMLAHFPIVFVVLLIAADILYAENIDPFDDGSQYAYGENVGWLNAEPSAAGSPGVEVGDTTLAGYIWAENIGWLSLSCLNTGSCDTVSYGVKNDGEGNLSGYAWGENVGWINFAPSAGGVYIQTATGEFAGTAWGENIGWISFRGESSIPFRILTSWEPVVNLCIFDSNDDGDVDGSDLAAWTIKLDGESLPEFALEFGMTDCFD